MKVKTIKVLAGLSTGIQAVAMLLIFFIVMNQNSVKTLYSTMDELLEIRSIPVTEIIICLCPLILYLFFFIYISSVGELAGGSKIMAAVFFGIGCLIKVVLGAITFLDSFLFMSMSTAEIASYQILRSAVSLVCAPFSTVAFALFCLAAGGSIAGAQKK